MDGRSFVDVANSERLGKGLKRECSAARKLSNGEHTEEGWRGPRVSSAGRGVGTVGNAPINRTGMDVDMVGDHAGDTANAASCVRLV